MQAEVVERLRLLSIGATVSLLISRLDDDVESIPTSSTTTTTTTESVITTAQNSANTTGIGVRVVSPSQPRQLPTEKANVDQLTNMQTMQTLTFDIALNDTGSAGLGVSVKGRTIEKADARHDCGIFVKSVIHGGAAHKDGRLRVNDQLIGIEDVDLTIERSNSEAMRRIGATMQRVGPNASCIQLRVARPQLMSSKYLSSVLNQTRVGSGGIVEEGESILLDTLTRRKGSYRQQQQPIGIPPRTASTG